MINPKEDVENCLIFIEGKSVKMIQFYFDLNNRVIFNTTNIKLNIWPVSPFIILPNIIKQECQYRSEA